MSSSNESTSFRFAHASQTEPSAVQIGLMYPDESQMLGIQGNEGIVAEMKCGKVHPLEQSSMISDEDKKWGPTHVARVLLEFCAISYPEKVPNIPQAHRPEVSSKFVFPEGCRLNIQQRESYWSLPIQGDSAKWKDRKNIVNSHSYLRQTYDDDGRPVTTYVDVFRWFRPCEDQALKLSVKTIRKRHGNSGGEVLLGGFLKRIFVNGRPVNESWRFHRTDYINPIDFLENEMKPHKPRRKSQKERRKSQKARRRSTKSNITQRDSISIDPKDLVPILLAFKWKDEDKDFTSHHLKSSELSDEEKTLSCSDSTGSFASIKYGEAEFDDIEKMERYIPLEGASVSAVSCEDDLEGRVFSLRYYPLSCEDATVVYFEVPTSVDCTDWIRRLGSCIARRNCHYEHKATLKHSAVSKMTWQSEVHRISNSKLQWGDFDEEIYIEDSSSNMKNNKKELEQYKSKIKTIDLLECVVVPSKSNDTDLKLRKKKGGFLTQKRQRRSVSIRCSSFHERQKWLRAIRVGIEISRQNVVTDIPSLNSNLSTDLSYEVSSNHSAAILHAPVAFIVLSKKPVSDVIRQRVLHIPLRQLFNGFDDTEALRAVWKNVINLNLNVSHPSLRYGYDNLWSMIRNRPVEEVMKKKRRLSSLSSGEQLMKKAQDLIDEHPGIGYLSLKSRLQDQFGETLFAVKKHDISNLLSNNDKRQVLNLVRELYANDPVHVTKFRIEREISKRFPKQNYCTLFKGDIRRLLEHLSTGNVKKRRRSSLRKEELSKKFIEADGALWEFLYANQTLLLLFTVRDILNSAPQSPAPSKPSHTNDVEKKKKKKKKKWFFGIFNRHDSENKDSQKNLKKNESNDEEEEVIKCAFSNGHPRMSPDPPAGWNNPVVVQLYSFLRQEAIRVFKASVACQDSVHFNATAVLDKLCNQKDVNEKSLEDNNHKIECGIEFMKVVLEAVRQNDMSDRALILAAIRIDSSLALERMVIAGKCVDMFISESENRTLLHVAIEHGDNVDIVQVLLDAGCDVDVVDNTGTSPVFEAVKRGRKEILRLLILAGANIHRADHKGYTPCSWIMKDKKTVAAGGRRHVFWSVNTWSEHMRSAIQILKAGRSFVSFYSQALGAKLPPNRSSTDHCWIVRKVGGDVSWRRRCQCCHLGLGLPDVVEEEQFMLQQLRKLRKEGKSSRSDVGQKKEALELLLAERHSMCTMSNVIWALTISSLRSAKELRMKKNIRVEDMNYILTQIWEFVRPPILECTMRLPRFDNAIDRICRVVPSQTLIALFECLILDMKVVLMSDNAWQLADACEAVMSLMYPLHIKDYCPSYFPMIMKDFDVKDILDTPFNFCYGVLKETLLDQNVMCVKNIYDGGEVDEIKSASRIDSSVLRGKASSSDLGKLHSRSSSVKGRLRHSLSLMSFESVGIAETDHRIRAVPQLSDSISNKWSDIPKFVTSAKLSDSSKFQNTYRKTEESAKARLELRLHKSDDETSQKFSKILGIQDAKDIQDTMKARALSTKFHTAASMNDVFTSLSESGDTSPSPHGTELDRNPSLEKVVRAQSTTWRSLELSDETRDLGTNICFIDLDVASGSRSAQEASRRAMEQLQWGMLAAVQRMNSRVPYVGVLPKRIRRHLLMSLYVAYGWNMDKTPLLSGVSLQSSCRFYDTMSTGPKHRVIKMSIRDNQIFASDTIRDLGRPVVRIRADRSEGKLYLYFTPRMDDIVLESCESPDVSLLEKEVSTKMSSELNLIATSIQRTIGGFVSPGSSKRSDYGPVHEVCPRADELDSVFCWLHDNAFRISLAKCRIDFNEMDQISFQDKTHENVTFHVSCGNLDDRLQYIKISFDGDTKPVRVLRHNGGQHIHVDLYGFASDVNLVVPNKDKVRVLEWVQNCWLRFSKNEDSTSRGTLVIIDGISSSVNKHLTKVQRDRHLSNLQLSILRARQERWTGNSRMENLEDDWFGNPLDRVLHVRHAFLESMANLLHPFFHSPAEFPDIFTLVPRGHRSAIRVENIRPDAIKSRFRLGVSYPGLGIGFVKKNRLGIVPSADSIEVTYIIEEYEEKNENEKKKKKRRVFIRIANSYVVAMSPRQLSDRKNNKNDVDLCVVEVEEKKGFVVVEKDMIRPEFVQNEDLVLGVRGTFEDRAKQFCVSDLDDMMTVSRVSKFNKMKFLEKSFCIKGLGNIFERSFLSEMYDTSSLQDLKGSRLADNLFLRWIKRSSISPSIAEMNHGLVMLRKWDDKESGIESELPDVGMFQMSLNAEIAHRFDSRNAKRDSRSFMSSHKPVFDAPYLIAVKICSASGLPSTDKDGLADPYVRLNCTPLNQSCDTKVCRNTLTPTWNQTIKFGPFKDWKSCRRAIIQFTVRDRDRVFDDNMGFCVISSERFDVNTNYDEYVSNELQSKIVIKDRDFGFSLSRRKYKNVFLGSEACLLLVKLGFAKHKEEAVVMGQRLLDKGFIEIALKSKRTFQDGPVLYRFVEKEKVPDLAPIIELPLRNLTIRSVLSNEKNTKGKLYVQMRIVPGCVPG